MKEILKEINKHYKLFDKIIGIRYRGYQAIFKNHFIVIYKEISLPDKKSYDLKFIKKVSKKSDIIEIINQLSMNEKY